MSLDEAICSKCKTKRVINRIGKDNTKPFWCSNCHKMVKPKKITRR